MTLKLKYFSRPLPKGLLILSGVGTLVLFLVISAINNNLITDVAPLGIISFELAPNLTQAKNIIYSWDKTQQMYAAFSLGIDYLFLFAYALFLSGLAGLIASMANAGNRFKKTGLLAGYLIWIAAGLDVIENIALFQILFNGSYNIWPPLAAGSATVKFLLVILTFIYILSGAIIVWFKPSKSNNESE